MRVFVGETTGVLRIADVVEVYPVYIVVGHDFAHNASQVIRSLGMSRVEVPGTFVLLAYLAVLAYDGVLAQELDLTVVAGRNGHYPRMEFHATLMTFFNGEGQWVVARIASGASGQGFGKSLDGRRIDQVSTEAGLKQHRVEVRFLQLVEDLA